MSKKLASLLIKISANGAEAEKTFRTLEKKVANFGKSMKRVGADISKYVTVPLTAMAGFAVKAANTQLQAEAKLLNALKGRADVQQRLIASAAELQSRSTVGDEAIIEQQAFLAALGLNESQIKSTIEAAVQLSAALGTSLDSATKNLAKTYGGLTGELGESIPALKNLTEEQLRNGEAIRFVNDNYKGFAETAASTGVGSLQQLRNQLGDLGEQIGVILLPVLQKITESLKVFVSWLQALPPATQKTIVGIGATVAAIGPLMVAIGKLVSNFDALANAKDKVFEFLGKIPNKVGIAVAAITGLAIAVDNLLHKAERLAQDRKSQIDSLYDRALEKHYDEYRRPIYSDDELRRMAEEIKEQNRLAFSTALSGTQDLAPLFAGVRAEYDAIIQVLDERQRAAEDAAAVEAAYRDGVKTEIGLINELNAELIRLEEAKKRATSESDIATLNGQIAELRTEIQRLDEVMPTFEKLGTVVSKFANPPQGKSIISLLMKPGEIIRPLDIEGFKSWMSELNGMSNLIDATAQALQNSLVGLFETLGEGLGAMLSGQDFNWVGALLNILGNLLSQLGSALIAYSTVMDAIKKALAGAGVAKEFALVAGLAAIAAGAALKAYASKPVKLAKGGLAYGPTLAVVGDNPGASNDPEVIAPLSKLGTMLGGQRMELMGDVEFVIHGDTMRAVLNRENVRLSRLK